VRVFLLGRRCQHFLHDDLVVGEGFVDGGALEVGGGVGFQTLEDVHVLWVSFQSPHQAAEVILHILLDAEVFLLLLVLDNLPLALLLLDERMSFELDFHLGLFDNEVENSRRELLDERLVEFEFLRVVDLVELDQEVAVEVEEDGDAVDDLLQNLERALRLHDGGLSQCLLQVVYDLIVPLLCLLHVLAQTGLVHYVTSARN
jgi:hypothetical protein